MGLNGKAAEFHCWHASTREEALQKGEYLSQLYRPFLRDGWIVELGCGEGAFLLWLKEHGRDKVIGVDSNEELCSLAETFGVPMVRADLLEYLRGQPLEKGIFLYLDVMEHVDPVFFGDPKTAAMKVLGLT